VTNRRKTFRPELVCIHLNKREGLENDMGEKLSKGKGNTKLPKDGTQRRIFPKQEGEKHHQNRLQREKKELREGKNNQRVRVILRFCL